MKGKISITRNSNNTISIEVEDTLSSTSFLNVNMTLENFALAITNLSYIDCDFDLRGMSYIGKKLEVKKEIVDLVDTTYDNFNERIKSLVKPYEVDGWEVEEYCLHSWNNHLVNNNKYTVTFRRYVNQK